MADVSYDGKEFQVEFLSEEEYLKAKQAAERLQEEIRTLTEPSKLSPIQINEVAVDIFQVTAPSLVVSPREDEGTQPIAVHEGEYIKILPDDCPPHHREFAYTVQSLTVGYGIPIHIKPGTLVAILPHDYKEQLLRHVSGEDSGENDDQSQQ